MISTHHEDTYKWAFRDSRRFILGDSSHESSDERGPDVTAWDSLTDWLRSNDELYWVSGKAGAGKSTFMAFLSRDSRTRELLDSWSPGARILSHFLWSAGQPLQKSVKGTLCSLLYQILFMDEDLFGRIIQNFPAAMTKDAVTDWSEPELEDLLQQTLSAAPMGTFIIIDGLDEVLSSDGSMKLLGLISRLQKTPGVKICVSSRPEPAFDRSLSRRPNLKLQDLTEHDIRCFVRATLEPYLTSGLEKSQSSLGDLADHICDTAQGVFLWVRIVLNSLQRGLENGDSFDDLLHRAQAFPRGLHELFIEMWRRLGDDEELYQLEAARYFNQVLSSRDVQLGVDISILEMMIALDESVRRIVFGSGGRIRHQRAYTKMRVNRDSYTHTVCRHSGVLYRILRGPLHSTQPVRFRIFLLADESSVHTPGRLRLSYIHNGRGPDTKLRSFYQHRPHVKLSAGPFSPHPHVHTCHSRIWGVWRR